MQRTRDLKHRWDHVIRVKDNAVKITKILGKEKQVDLRMLKICCLLHDITYFYKKQSIQVYFFEGTIAKRKVSLILKRFNINKNDRKTIEYAVKVHHLSFPFAKLNRDKDIYTKILQDADTIDYFSKERINPYGSGIERNFIKKVIYYFVVRLTDYGKANIEDYLNYPKIGRLFYPRIIFPESELNDPALESVKIK